MEHALRLPGRNSLLVALVAFVLGASGATLTYAAADSGSIDFGSGDGSSVRPAPHAGIGGAVDRAP
jgi:hypothetical protein